MLTKQPIHFGTDGWRSLFARQFTYGNVRRVADALARDLKPRSRVAVAYDHRFMAESFAVDVCRVMAGRGHHPCLADRPATSPALSFMLKPLRAAVGVMITASHNPAVYGGFKIKVPPGRSADSALTARIEKLIEPVAPPLSSDGPFEMFHPFKEYADSLASRCDERVWRARSPRVVVDAMHGTAGPVWDSLLKRFKVRGTLVRATRDPLFGGAPPEPIADNLTPLVEAVRKTTSDMGLAMDGDGDRLGVVDDTGAYVPPHTVFPLILKHLVKNRGLKGAVVQAVSLGVLSERMAKAWKLPFVEVPVGFKYVAEEMDRRKVLLGGEESGGYGVGGWGRERDGVLAGLLLMEMVATSGKPLSVLRRELYEEFGPSDFKRVDVTLRNPVSDKSAWMEAVSRRVPERLAGRPVAGKSTRDGLKISLEGGAWLLLRPSGTEPLLRVYAESPDEAVTAQLLHKGQEWAVTKVT